MQVDFERFDPKEAPEQTLEALHKLNSEIEREYLPDEEPGPLAEMLSTKRNRAGHKVHVDWLARDPQQSVLGSAALFYEQLEENKHLGWFWIQVPKTHRRNSIGTALFEQVINEAKSAEKSVLGGWAWQDGPGEKFLAKLGGTKRMLERQGRLWVRDVDLKMMNTWVERANERATKYRLRAWQGSTPEDVIEKFATAYDVMNTAPREDLDMEDEKTTPDILREREKARVEQGNPWWTLIAVHEPTGEIAGFTEIYFSGYRDDIAWQGNTGVDPAHRNKGLGRWLKGSMFLRLVEERPNTTRIHTWNAGSNEPMLAINNAMGFHVAQWWTTWQAPTEIWEKSVTAKISNL